MSIELIQEIIQLTDYLEADLNEDPTTMLFRIATESNVSAIHGGSAGLRGGPGLHDIHKLREIVKYYPLSDS